MEENTYQQLHPGEIKAQDIFIVEQLEKNIKKAPTILHYDEFSQV